MSRVKVHSKRPGAVKLNQVEKEKSRKGRVVAMGAAITLVVLIVSVFLLVRGH